MRSRASVWWSLVFFSVAGSCSKAGSRVAAKSPQSAVVVAADRVIVTLTPEAREHLGIALGSVAKRDIQRTRTLAGDVRVPPGRSVTLTAPFASCVRGLEAKAGMEVADQATVMSLSPLLSADSRASFAMIQVDAEAAAVSSKALYDGAELELARVERMQREGVGSERAVEQARVARDSAKAQLEAVVLRRDRSQNAVDGSLETLPVRAPIAGTVRQILVAEGQQVPAGVPLVEIADLSLLWVRVPVSVDEANTFDGGAEVTVDGLVGRRASAPPSGDSITNTVDLWYEVENRAGALRPGQSVFVPIRLAGEVAHLVVPASAILRDERGRAFVYTFDAEEGYVRRVVEVQFVHAGEAAITGSVRVGDPIVVTGVAELWGIESGHAR